MTMNTKRRIFLKGSIAAGSVGFTIGTGMLSPRSVVAAWNEKAFQAKSADDALGAAMGGATSTASDVIKIKAPDIAENGAVVPVSVEVDMEGVESIALLAEGNNTPLVATFNLGLRALPNVSTRIKMNKTSDIIAVAKANGQLHSARKSRRVYRAPRRLTALPLGEGAVECRAYPTDSGLGTAYWPLPGTPGTAGTRCGEQLPGWR